MKYCLAGLLVLFSLQYLILYGADITHFDEYNTGEMVSLDEFKTEYSQIFLQALSDGSISMPYPESTAGNSACINIGFSIGLLYGANQIMPECKEAYMPVLEKFAGLLENEKVKAEFAPLMEHKLSVAICTFFILNEMMPEDYKCPFEIPEIGFVGKSVLAGYTDITPALARYIYLDSYNFDRKLDALEAVATGKYDEYQQIAVETSMSYLNFAAKLQMIFDPECERFDYDGTESSFKIIMKLASKNEVIQKELDANPVVKLWLEEWQERLASQPEE